MVALEETSSFIGTPPRRGSYGNLIAMYNLLIIGIIQSDLSDSRLEFGIRTWLRTTHLKYKLA
jgi:hypothetical protein